MRTLLFVLLTTANIGAAEVPFGDHGITVTVPTWEYSEVRLSHYHADAKNLDLCIYTCNLSNREDQGEGILLRYSPSIKTFEDHIGERLQIQGKIARSPNDTPYKAWSHTADTSANSLPFDIAPLLQEMGLKPQLKFHSFLKRGPWHSFQAYYNTSRGVYAIYVWDNNDKPTVNARIKNAFGLIRVSSKP